jgi:hypothetical protein
MGLGLVLFRGLEQMPPVQSSEIPLKLDRCHLLDPQSVVAHQGAGHDDHSELHSYQVQGNNSIVLGIALSFLVAV